MKILVLQRVPQCLRGHSAVANHRHQFVRYRQRTAVKACRQRFLDVFLRIANALDTGPTRHNGRTDQPLQVDDNVVLGFCERPTNGNDLASHRRRKNVLAPTPESRHYKLVHIRRKLRNVSKALLDHPTQFAIGKVLLDVVGHRQRVHDVTH